MSLSKNIREEWSIFSTHLYMEVGDGLKVKFWHDRWCGDLPLREAYPKLFFISWAKDAYVADLISFGTYMLH